ncbi:conserved hypothetical protein [Beggiatoa sp. PS]|nr:conserved hypothetical protein [Beggiatoa sp. PS]
MTQKIHDHFAKQYLAYLLDKYGQTKISHEIVGTSFQVDLVFSPNDTADRQAMGLLGQMASHDCFIEVFSYQPQKQEIRTCLVKLYLKHNELYNKARNEKKSLSENKLPHLWIITTSASVTLMNSFKATHYPPNWSQGIYFFGESFKTAVVAINQLPTTPETLWLRLLGKGAIRQQAINELIALPDENVLRNQVLKLVYNYLKAIESQSQKTQEEEELFMELSPAYYQWEKETLQKGMQQGMQKMQRIFVENMLKLRFGLSNEEIAGMIEPLLKLPPEESTRILLQSSREELLKKYQ